ncbi:MAG: hypothetical protein WDN72_08890 [Alphaproteobacteria bacterium]
MLETLARTTSPPSSAAPNTLRFYGAILAEDLQRMHSKGYFRLRLDQDVDGRQRQGHTNAVPPVLLVTSMHTFEDKPEHVRRILRAVPFAAAQAMSVGHFRRVRRAAAG